MKNKKTKLLFSTFSVFISSAIAGSVYLYNTQPWFSDEYKETVVAFQKHENGDIELTGKQLYDYSLVVGNEPDNLFGSDPDPKIRDRMFEESIRKQYLPAVIIAFDSSRERVYYSELDRELYSLACQALFNNETLAEKNPDIAIRLGLLYLSNEHYNPVLAAKYFRFATPQKTQLAYGYLREVSKIFDCKVDARTLNILSNQIYTNFQRGEDTDTYSEKVKAKAASKAQDIFSADPTEPFIYTFEPGCPLADM